MLDMRGWICCIIFLMTACNSGKDSLLPQNDNILVVYYVIPKGEMINEDFFQRIEFVVNQSQQWYQVATGGLTFELEAEKDFIEIYYAGENLEYYSSDWWNKLLVEMKEQKLAIESPGTIAMVWVQGLEELDDNALGLAGELCGGTCGVALLPTVPLGDLIFQQDIATYLHEIGHTLGLSHPVEVEDLPLDSADQIILRSVMCQKVIRQGESTREHGFLTFEKEILSESNFLKKDVSIEQSMRTTILNYPVTDSLPIIEFDVIPIGSKININNNSTGAETYYWTFGEGSISHEKSPAHTFSIPGQYTIRLMATSPGKMVATGFRTIEIL